MGIRKLWDHQKTIMFSFILSFILFVLFAFFPVFLWGYWVSLLSHHEWNRVRFLYGIIGGGLGVLVIWIFKMALQSTLILRMSALTGILLLMLIFVWIATARGSTYVRVFLRKISLLHALFFLLIVLVVEVWLQYLPLQETLTLPILGSMAWYFFSASIEESLKHLSSVWLTAKQFRFSRRDLLVFSFFIVLGFSFVENIVYLYPIASGSIGKFIFAGVSRSCFSLLAHLFSASICVMFWWKALSYRIFSPKYCLTFILGFILACMAHVGFNLLVIANLYWGIILYAVIAYGVFTQWLALDA